ncbi:hypothetical protein [Candidatus Poriferisocius sp.]|uniref:hypothetical protein n=1 Tax=Candidatus Poriferisocius sp. TaxID=3101276 RepID=UPI003B015CFE
MSRRIEIELTSQRPDGSWTWRAAGAREPKGELAGDLIAFAAHVGDELTVEAEFHMDGIEIIEAFESKKKRPMPETLEILGSGRDQPLVTTQLVSSRKGRDRDRPGGDRRGRQDRRGRGDRKERDRQESRRQDDRPKAKRLRPGRVHRQALIEGLSDEEQPVAEQMVREGITSIEQALRDQRKKARDAAKAKKEAAANAAKEAAELTKQQAAEAAAEAPGETADAEAATEAAAEAPGETADAEAATEAAAQTPEETADAEAATEAPRATAATEPTADTPRETANAEAAAQTPKDSADAKSPVESPKPEAADDFLSVAGKLLSRMRAAEWRDRADAALAGIDDIDLRDLRSVVVAAEAGAADDEAKAMAEELRTKLTERVDREHAEWLAEVAATLADGRMVRALRLSSRPPKAGVPLPQDMVTRLTEAASAALAGDTPTKRWTTVLNAVAFSPVRRTVQPQGIPEKPDKELLDEVTKLSERVPHIAALFGIEPTPPPRRGRRGASARASA